MDSESFGFLVEWYDSQADLMREYQLTVFKPQKGSLEAAMYDPKAHRGFLKRTPVPSLKMEDLLVGSTVTIYARHLKVKAYADSHTRNALECKRASFVAKSALFGHSHKSFNFSMRLAILLQPPAFPQLGQLVSCIESGGLKIQRLRLVNESGPVVALEVVGDDADLLWSQACGHVPATAYKQVPRDQIEPYFCDRDRWDVGRS
eukprot:g25989.t1